MEGSVAGFFQPLVDFVKENAFWAPFLVGALAFGESLWFI
jgi:hypothetical protein